MRNIIAGHDGEGRNARFAAANEAREEKTEYGLRLVKIDGIALNMRMLGIEFSSGGIDVVATLGDGQRGDLDCWIRKRCQNRSCIAWRQVINHRSSDTGRAFIGFLLDDRRKPVLRQQLLAHFLVGGAHTRADKRKFMVLAEIEQIVQIDGLV